MGLGLLVLLGVGATEPVAAPEIVEVPLAPVDSEDVDADVATLDEDDPWDERTQLRKKGIPLPPSQNRKAYRAWRKKLPRAIQKKIERHCREHGGDYQLVCNGIGPYAIPHAPSLAAMPRPRGAAPDPRGSRKDWLLALSAQQRSYVSSYCETPLPPDPTDEQLDEWEGRGYSELCGGTPLVLAFESERVAYTTRGQFALIPGMLASTDWPTSATPWIARDVDGNGAITSGAELFGGSTRLPDGSTAAHGFAALAPLDSNGDRILDARDPAFASLLVWADRDGDRTSTPSELTKLADTVERITLDYQRVPHCDARGNCEGERAAMTWRDASGAVRTGTVIDVYLRYR